MKINLCNSMFRNLVYGASIFGFLSACGVKDQAENSTLKGGSGCVGMDAEYIANWFLPGESGEALDAYDKNYSRAEAKERLACDIGGAINAKWNEEREHLSRMALGFAKKAALRFLDGYTGGLAASFFGNSMNSQGSAGPSTQEIKQAIDKIVNDAFDNSEHRAFETQYAAFVDRFGNYRSYAGVTKEAGKIIPPYKTLYDMKVSGSPEFSELYRERYEGQLNRLIDLQGLATDLLNVSYFETDFRGKPQFKLAKPFQLILGIYASVTRDLKGGDIADVVDKHLQKLDRMEKAIAEHALSMSAPPISSTSLVDEINWKIQFGVEQYKVLSDKYLGDDYDAFMMEMSKITGKPVPKRAVFPDYTLFSEALKPLQTIRYGSLNWDQTKVFKYVAWDGSSWNAQIFSDGRFQTIKYGTLNWLPTQKSIPIKRVVVINGREVEQNVLLEVVGNGFQYIVDGTLNWEVSPNFEYRSWELVNGQISRGRTTIEIKH